MTRLPLDFPPLVEMVDRSALEFNPAESGAGAA